MHCHTLAFFFCVFQDILTRKILGYGVRRSKLYYLKLTEKGGGGGGGGGGVQIQSSESNKK